MQIFGFSLNRAQSRRYPRASLEAEALIAARV
jgi:hypothetical protein